MELYEILDINLNFALVIITFCMAIIIGSQLLYIKRASNLENNIESLKFLDSHYDTHLKLYSDIINNISDNGDNAIFDDDEVKNMEYLLNRFEILSTHVEYGKIDIGIVDSISGNIIKSVMGNNTIKKVISKQQQKDPTNFERIIKLHGKLMKIKN